MKAHIGFGLLFIILVSEQVLASKDEIIFATAIIRHGARTMLNKQYENIVDDKSFLSNPGRLTNIGKHQLYLLGRQFADKYMNLNVLLNPRYKHRQIVVRTSGANRTIESVQSFLAGLYEPGLGPSLTFDQIENASPPIAVENLDRIRQELRSSALPYHAQRFAIHTSNAEHDYLFSPHSECEGVAEDEKSFKSEFAKIDKKYKDFLNKLNQSYQLEVNCADDAYKLYDNIVCAQRNNINLTKKFSDYELEMLKNISFECNTKIFPRSDLKVKLLVYVIFADMIKHFTNAKNNKDGKLKMAVFQVSDTHILAINKLMPLNLKESVSFASSLVFELHRRVDDTSSEQFIVEAYYNGERVNFEEKGLQKYEQFERLLKDNTYESEDLFMEACHGNTNGYDRDVYMALTVVLFITFIGLWGSNWFILTRKPKDTTTASTLSADGLTINEQRYSALVVNETKKEN